MVRYNITSTTVRCYMKWPFYVSHLRWIRAIFVVCDGDDCFLHWVKVMPPLSDPEKLLICSVLILNEMIRSPYEKKRDG